MQFCKGNKPVQNRDKCLLTFDLEDVRTTGPLIFKKAILSLLTRHVCNHVIQDYNHQVVVIGKSLELFCVLQQKVTPLNEVDLPICLNEVVAHRENIVYHDQLGVILLYPC